MKTKTHKCFCSDCPEHLLKATLETPAFVYDESAILDLLKRLQGLRENGKLLFSIKALPWLPLLMRMRPYLDGYSVSSLFEARLVGEIDNAGTVHITTPGLREQEMSDIVGFCQHLSFNSLSQWQRLAPYALEAQRQCGLRVNPQQSFLNDIRYDPCRPASKLGVPLSELATLLRSKPAWLSNLTGLHVHNIFNSMHLEPLEQTVAILEAQLGTRLGELQWLNLGGGYRFDHIASLTPLKGLVSGLQQRYGLQILYEPGKAIVSEAGYLVASVIDLFNSDGKAIAILDTSVNHLPEVFEYQRSPRVHAADGSGVWRYRLAGSSCLSGDIFGEYSFSEPLALGSRVVFTDVGAYSLIKASRFNGINFPTLYAYTEAKEVCLVKQFTYEEFSGQWRG